MSLIDKFYCKYFTKKIMLFEDDSAFSITFPNNWRKMKTLNKQYTFFEETKNYGLVIKVYDPQKISFQTILENYKKKHSDCTIKVVEENLQNFKVIKWAFHFYKERVLEYKRIIIASNIILDISYCIHNDLLVDEQVSAMDILNEIMKSVIIK